MFRAIINCMGIGPLVHGINLWHHEQGLRHMQRKNPCHPEVAYLIQKIAQLKGERQ